MDSLRRTSLGGSFGGIFLVESFWEDFLGGFSFGRNYLVKIDKELIFLSGFWGNFVSIHKEGRRKEEGRNLRKLIALKKIK